MKHKGMNFPNVGKLKSCKKGENSDISSEISQAINNLLSQNIK